MYKKIKRGLFFLFFLLSPSIFSHVVQKKQSLAAATVVRSNDTRRNIGTGSRPPSTLPIGQEKKKKRKKDKEKKRKKKRKESTDWLGACSSLAPLTN